MDVLQGLIEQEEEGAGITLWHNLPIDPDHLPVPENGIGTGIEDRWLAILKRRNLFISLGLLVAAIICYFIFREILILGGILLAVLWFAVGMVYLPRLHRSRKYYLRELDITWHNGWLWRSITSVPYNRIQHVEIGQGIIEKWVGLATLHVYTAGKSSSDLSIPGLNLLRAEQLKDYILNQVSMKEEE